MNSKALLSVLLVPIAIGMCCSLGWAQNLEVPDCAGRILEEDNSAGSYTLAFKQRLVVQNSNDDMLEFDLKQFNGSIVIAINIKGAGDCLDEVSSMTARFTSGKVVKLPMNAFFNCDREYVSFFGGGFGRKNELQQFVDNEIEWIRVETRKSIAYKDRKNFVEVKFTPAQAQEFRERMECLVGEAQ
jgi:hypothetical protein